MLIRSSIVLLAAVLLGGCAASYAPDDWLPEADMVQEEQYGAWISLTPVNANPRLKTKYVLISGEFIGADSNYVYVLGGSIQAVPADSITRSVLELADTDRELYPAWGLLGALSTISHGFFLVFSLPTWIITGSIISSNEVSSNRYEEENPPKEYWSRLLKFSRFPQGMPPGLDLNKLKPKKDPPLF
jgi:hypothetical protein